MGHSTPITDIQEIENVINSCKTCYLSMVDENNMPYNLPFNFGYEDNIFYFHGSKTGRRNTILKHNPNVCIAFTTGEELYAQDKNVACSYGMKFKSILVFGKVEFVEEYEQKVIILNKIMKQYTGTDNFMYNTPAVNNICCFKVVAERITGKQRN